MVQNLTTCLYRTELGSVTVTWCRTLMGGQSLTLTVLPDTQQKLRRHDFDSEEDDFDEAENDSAAAAAAASASQRLQMNPWFFWKKKGAKKFLLNGKKTRIFWDLSRAKFSSGSVPEPDRNFYLCIVSDNRSMSLLIGDLVREAYAKTGAHEPVFKPVLLSRREHVFGKKLYSARARFDDGRNHDITIECLRDEPGLSFRVDEKPVLEVRRLMWKFRGNERIVVDGVPVQVYWDVHNWLFNSGIGHAVFMFMAERTGSLPGSVSDGGLSSPMKSGSLTGSWPTGFGPNGPEKGLLKTGSLSSSFSSSCSSGGSSSILEWANTDTDSSATGFSLVVYAWKS